MATMETIQQTLQTLYTSKDPQAREQANEALQTFQKTDQAWATANGILQAPEAPLESKVFAAQTFRAKIVFDLEALDPQLRAGLRESLLAALSTYAAGGARIVLTQLCLALADLALQLPDWRTVVPDMMERFGRTPGTVPTLLGFLTVFAQENVQARFRVQNEDWRSPELPDQIVSTLSLYLGAAGVTDSIRTQVFECLSAWLRAGEIAPASIANSPVLDHLFSALSSDVLFDPVVDSLCDLIHETQEIDDNMQVIEQVVPRLVALKPSLAENADDADRLRGYCRVFVEAGECYAPLIVEHPDAFLPIVEAIALCCAQEDLDVVGITFNFWYRLANRVARRRTESSVRPLMDIYAHLVETIIRHLHYPEHLEDLKGQDGEDFRRFRHDIGDTLKDCCHVLGADRCLQRAYDLIVQAMHGQGPARWQDVEAPLFSMRTMGAEVDPRSDTVLPQIMEIIPKLPSHPKIRYATILVLCRYTEWTNLHPEGIPFQLQYISSGFDDPSDDVKLAAAQAMKFLCRDCSGHLVSYLPQLHSFVQTVGPSLAREDLNEVSAAIAHIIAAMPQADATQALRLFCMPIVESVHKVASSGQHVDKATVAQVSDGLGRLDTFLNIVDSFPEPLPTECTQTLAEVWHVIDSLLENYGHVNELAEGSCAVIRRGLQFFGPTALSIASGIVQRMTLSFERSGGPSYLWITGKVAWQFRGAADEGLSQALGVGFERESAKVFAMLRASGPAAIPDVLDDYIHLLIALHEAAPNVLYLSPSFTAIFQVALACLTLPNPSTLLTTLELLRDVLGHDSLDSAPSSFSSGASTPNLNVPSGPAGFAAVGPAIRAAVQAHGFQLCQLLLTGLLVDFPEDAVSTVVTLFALLSTRFPDAVKVWVPPIAEGLPSKAASPNDRAAFVAKFNGGMAEGRPNFVKDALMSLIRASRRDRQRRDVRLDSER